jgi:hypothetical protein
MKQSNTNLFTNYWFAKVKPLVRFKDRQVEASITELYPHGALLEISELERVPDLMEHVHLDLRHPTEDAWFSVHAAVVVTYKQANAWQLRFSFFKITQNHSSLSKKSVRAGESEFRCPPEVRPQVWADHPWYLNVRVQLSIESFVTGGARAAIHSEARGLIRDLVMPFQIAVPNCGLFTVQGRVIGVSLQNWPHDSGTIHLEWIEPSQEFLDATVRYILMMMPEVEPETLVTAGYQLPDFHFAAALSQVSSEKDMNEVLKLRLLAYSSREESTLNKNADIEVMRDKFDAHSLIFMVRVGARVFGTTRLVWNNSDKTKSEIEELCPLPDWIWQKGFVELSRSATMPGLRGRDVFPILRRHAFRSAFQAGFRYIVSDCEEHMLKPYMKRGAKEMGVTFIHPLEGKTLHVLYYDIEEILAGENVDPDAWSAMWKPMADFLTKDQ